MTRQQNTLKTIVLIAAMLCVLSLKSVVETGYFIFKLAKSKTDWLQDQLEAVK